MFKKILVPSDGSDLAHKAAEFAADLAKVHGAEVIGVYVIDPFPYIGIGDASAIGLQAYLTEAKGAAGQALDLLRKACEASRRRSCWRRMMMARRKDRPSPSPKVSGS